MWETCVRSLSWEDTLEKGTTTHSSILLENSMDRGAWRATVHGVTKSQTRLSDKAQHSKSQSLVHFSVYTHSMVLGLEIIYYVSRFRPIS